MKFFLAIIAVVRASTRPKRSEDGGVVSLSNNRLSLKLAPSFLGLTKIEGNSPYTKYTEFAELILRSRDIHATEKEYKADFDLIANGINSFDVNDDHSSAAQHVNVEQASGRKNDGVFIVEKSSPPAFKVSYFKTTKFSHKCELNTGGGPKLFIEDYVIEVSEPWTPPVEVPQTASVNEQQKGINSHDMTGRDGMRDRDTSVGHNTKGYKATPAEIEAGKRIALEAATKRCYAMYDFISSIPSLRKAILGLE